MVAEPAGLAVVREYEIPWKKQSYEVARIAKHLGVSYDSVHMRLRELKDRNGCYSQLSVAAKRLVSRA